MAICYIRRFCSSAASTQCAKISAANSKKPNAISAANITEVSKTAPPNPAKNATPKPTVNMLNLRNSQAPPPNPPKTPTQHLLTPKKTSLPTPNTKKYPTNLSPKQVNEFVGCLTSRTGRTSLTVAGETGKNTNLIH